MVPRASSGCLALTSWLMPDGDGDRFYGRDLSRPFLFMSGYLSSPHPPGSWVSLPPGKLPGAGPPPKVGGGWISMFLVSNHTERPLVPYSPQQLKQLADLQAVGDLSCLSAFVTNTLSPSPTSTPFPSTFAGTP
ncbi:hypothetical protein EOD39_2364 [Acipenser ruthenus]|uniref:Uncharacterized protein n=1 Tax=Acipenser ruthenus TaxID=7906 RepID=A0A444U216_ACIRT|nr:hypothetical protein EOD39_2364 [Acipenser ruthenus]